MGMMPPAGGPPTVFRWDGRRQKPADTGPANSGLTGDAAIDQPPLPEGPKDLRGRWESLKQSVTGTTAALPRVLRLVWDASPSTTLGLFVATAISGLIPAASAGAAALLVNTVVDGIQAHGGALPGRDVLSLGPWQSPDTAVPAIFFYAIVQLLLFALSSLLSTIRNITQQLLQDSVTQRIQLMVMEKAASLDLQFYEDPASYDLLRRAQTDSINRPVMMISTGFGLVQTLLTFLTMIVLLVAVSPLLAAIALLSPIPAFIADSRYGWRGYFIARYKVIAHAFYESQRSQVARRYMTGFLLGNLSTIATAFTYLYVALQAVAGRRTLG